MAERVEVLLSEEKVNARIRQIGEQISRDYEGKELHLVCILKGASFFTCELAKRITVPVSLDFMSVSSYGASSESSGVVKIVKSYSKQTSFLNKTAFNQILQRRYMVDFCNAEHNPDHTLQQIHPESEIRYNPPLHNSVFPVLLVTIVCVFFFVMMNSQNAAGSGGGKMMNFGKSRAKLSIGDNKITLNEVAGRHVCFSGNRFGKQRLTGTRRTLQQNALRNSGAHLGKLTGFL